jgi:hypothetical protein
MTSPSGFSRLTSYDAAGQIASIISRTSSGTVRQRWTFTYDTVGSRDTVRDGASTTT